MRRFVLKGKASWNDRKIGLWRFLVTKVIRSYIKIANIMRHMEESRALSERRKIIATYWNLRNEFIRN